MDWLSKNRSLLMIFVVVFYSISATLFVIVGVQAWSATSNPNDVLMRILFALSEFFFVGATISLVLGALGFIHSARAQQTFRPIKHLILALIIILFITGIPQFIFMLLWSMLTQQKV